MRRYIHSSGRILELRFWLFGWWGSLFCPTEICCASEPAWVWKRIYPRWYAWLLAVRLFLSIVWREGYGGTPLDVRTAWDVAYRVHGEESQKPF